MDVVIYSDCIDWSAREQIYDLLKTPAFKDQKIRIMPDCHAGAGCVVGFTSTMGDAVIPNVIGVDIGCGMRVAELGEMDIDLQALDEYIKRKIPAGMEVGDTIDSRASEIIGKLRCKNNLKNVVWLEKSLGTLGGGNHFIEIDRGDKGLYLVIHTGSRNLGKQVAQYYQKLAIKRIKEQSDEEYAETKATIELLKKQGKQAEIDGELKKIKLKYRQNTAIADDLCYLTGNDLLNYMFDMRLCQEFAVLNRTIIMNKLIAFLGLGRCEIWECVHNYVDDNNIIRKGAISAHLGERVIIPMNMRDGCLIGRGKGNEEWNESAPHGAGRIMSRAEAKRQLSIEQFTSQMEGIYTTTVNITTLDEAPMAYKPMEEILKFLDDTVELEDIIKPIYNFKAAGD